MSEERKIGRMVEEIREDTKFFSAKTVTHQYYLNDETSYIPPSKHVVAWRFLDVVLEHEKKDACYKYYTPWNYIAGSIVERGSYEKKSGNVTFYPEWIEVTTPSGFSTFKLEPGDVAFSPEGELLIKMPEA